MSRLLKNIYSKEFYNNFSEILGEVVVSFAGNFDENKEIIMEFFTKLR